MNTHELYHDNIGCVELIDYMGDDKRAVDAARVSFMRDNTSKALTDKDKRLIKFLADHKHTSPFEHMTATFRLTVPLFVRSQIMRHRTFSYNEVSRRYTSENIQVWLPQQLRRQSIDNLQCSAGDLDNHLALNLVHMSILSSVDSYHDLINRGVSRELARAVLPQATYTTFYMTGNLHNWVKFLKLRNDDHAQPETREAAQAIEAMLSEHFPVTMQALFNGES
jgi:thymidylate synthase (FAD)